MTIQVGDLLTVHKYSYYLGQKVGTSFKVLEIKDGKVYWDCPIFDKRDGTALNGVHQRFHIIPSRLEND